MTEYSAQTPTESARSRGLLIGKVGGRRRGVAAPLPADGVAAFDAPLVSAACSPPGGWVEVGNYGTGVPHTLLERTSPW